MRLVAILSVFSLVALAQDSRESMNQGVQAYKSGNYVEAVNAFQTVLDSDPANNAAHSFLVDTLATLAFIRYQEAQSAPDPAQKFTKLDESAALYRRLSIVDPANKLAYYFVGMIDWMKWHPVWLEARTSMGMKTDQRGPLPITAVRRELAEQYSRTIEDGIAQLQKVLTIDPQYSDAMAYINLLIRERADLRDTPDEYRQDIETADAWVRKSDEVTHAKSAEPRVRDNSADSGRR